MLFPEVIGCNINPNVRCMIYPLHSEESRRSSKQYRLLSFLLIIHCNLMVRKCC